MEQTKALNALEPFLALSKSATSPRAAADLVTRATSAPNTYIFTELLQTPQIQALASSDEFAPYLNLLQIFSYGTYSSYTSTVGLPALNDAQTLKLRQLSLLTLAKKNNNTDSATSPALGYASLQQALDLPSRQALEELVISAIYAGLIKAQLNPKDSLVQINSVAPLRDVAPIAINGLLSSLQAWAGRCDETLRSLSSQMAQIRNDANHRAAQAATRAQKTHKLMENEKKGGHSAPAVLNEYSTRWPADGNFMAPTISPLSRKVSLREPVSQVRAPGSGGHGGGGGNKNTNNNPTTNDNKTPSQMNNMLTDGGGSSSLTFGGPSTSTPATGAADLEVNPAVKRSCDDMASSTDDIGGRVDEGRMDVDDDEDMDGKKRKLEE
ncbi:hypothetical protein VTI74DRAFT_11061 [Chaetomium olivicolor]